MPISGIGNSLGTNSVFLQAPFTKNHLICCYHTSNVTDFVAILPRKHCTTVHCYCIFLEFLETGDVIAISSINSFCQINVL